MASRRLSFWIGVAAVSVLSNVAITALAERVPQLGLAGLVHYAHKQ